MPPSPTWVTSLPAPRHRVVVSRPLALRVLVLVGKMRRLSMTRLCWRAHCGLLTWVVACALHDRRPPNFREVDAFVLRRASKLKAPGIANMLLLFSERPDSKTQRFVWPTWATKAFLVSPCGCVCAGSLASGAGARVFDGITQNNPQTGRRPLCVELGEESKRSLRLEAAPAPKCEQRSCSDCRGERHLTRPGLVGLSTWCWSLGPPLPPRVLGFRKSGPRHQSGEMCSWLAPVSRGSRC